MTTRSSIGNRDNRRKAAASRQEVADKRTPQQQLEHLDATFGKGQGAAKERAKLQARIEGKGPKKGDHKPEAAAATGKTGGQPTGAPHADGGNPYKKNKHRGHGERH